MSKLILKKKSKDCDMTSYEARERYVIPAPHLYDMVFETRSGYYKIFYIRYIIQKCTRIYFNFLFLPMTIPTLKRIQCDLSQYFFYIFFF